MYEGQFEHCSVPATVASVLVRASRQLLNWREACGMT